GLGGRGVGGEQPDLRALRHALLPGPARAPRGAGSGARAGAAGGVSEIPLTPVELPPVPPGSTTAGCTAADDVLCDWVLEGAAPPAVDMTRLEEIYARPGFEEAASRGADGWERMIAELLGLLESIFGTSGAQGFAEWTRFLVLAA